MGNNPQKHSNPRSEKPLQISSIEEKKFMAIMRQIGDASPNVSEDHITAVLEQRAKDNDNIHEENMQEHERFKLIQRNSLIQLAIILLFATFVLGLVAFVDRSYMPQALTLIIGFVGGFGIGKTLKDSHGTI